MIEAARSSREGDRLADFIVLALNTGGRKNELLKLEWRHVNWKHALITLEPDDTKSGKRQTIPLNEDAVPLPVQPNVLRGIDLGLLQA
ncbi:tyrosine-type recombinase/integrase [Vreelandella sp. EE7]